jgi:glucose/arabinose dehydrogenase
MSLPGRRPALALRLVALLGTVLLGACEDDDELFGPEPESLALELLAQGTLVSPVALVEAPDGSGLLYVVDQVGVIRVIDAQGQLLPQPFLDISSRMVTLSSTYDERGLLGLAFDPNYARNRRFYVYYSAPLRSTAPVEWDHTSRVSRFDATDPFRASASTERTILQVDQPQANNNGGMLAFGPDELLYISVGDGGGSGDIGVGHAPDGNAQTTTNLLGSILRIDVRGAEPYTSPPTNYFFGRTDGRHEIYAFGFRNPYRFSFDRVTGDLIAGDAGQNRWEEVDRVISGGNYGWNVREGLECFDPNNPNQNLSTCASNDARGEPFRDPVAVYRNVNNPDGGIGTAVIGGFVYRGSEVLGLHGLYVFGDFSRSFQAPDGTAFFAVPRGSGGTRLWDIERLPFGDRSEGRIGHYLKGFGEDAEGELYFLTSDRTGPTGVTGRVYKLVPHDP